MQEDLWVPVVRMHGRLIILPGVPKLFRALLDGMTPYLPVPPSTSKPFRLLVHTAMPESGIAPYLGELANRVKSERIRVGRCVVRLIINDRSRLRLYRKAILNFKRALYVDVYHHEFRRQGSAD